MRIAVNVGIAVAAMATMEAALTRPQGFPAGLPAPYALWKFLLHHVPGDVPIDEATRVLASLPGIAVGLVVYHLLSWPLYNDGRTRCGMCGKRLRNLTEPRCPACGRSL